MVVVIYKRKNKFNAQKTKVGDRIYDSKKEARYCEQLKILQDKGVIKYLKLQKPYELKVGNFVIGRYIPDAVYYDTRDNRLHIVDVKGKDTALSKWKRKHFLGQYKQEVEVV